MFLSPLSLSVVVIVSLSDASTFLGLTSDIKQAEVCRVGEEIQGVCKMLNKGRLLLLQS